MSDLHTRTVTELATVQPPPTSRDLVQDCLDRIRDRDDTIGAFTHVAWEQAIADARARDDETARGETRGSLHGIPVAIKDIFDTRGMPTAYGSQIWAGHRPACDASCVSLLRGAGAVIIGKTVTAEFAFNAPGPTRNPHNLEHTPGGSSQGSAASVSDFMVPLSLGTQTAGSVIRPASFCGVVGYKPTYNWIERSGLKLASQSLDTIGIMGRSVPDVWLVAGALVRPGAASVVGLAEPPRIGVCRTHVWDRAESGAQAQLEEAVSRLARAGAQVRDVELPPECEGLVHAQERIATFEAARSLAQELNESADLLSDDLRDRLLEGASMPHEEYTAARNLQDQCATLVDGIWDELDVLATLPATGEAPRGLTWTGDHSFNSIWTVVQTPCVTLPVFTGPTGLPIGLQVVGPRHRDAAMLSAAEWIHRALM